MSVTSIIERGAIEDINIDVYDLSAVEPAEGNPFVPGFYFNIAVEEDTGATEFKSEQQVRLAGPYSTSTEALAAGKAFVRDALDGATTQEAA